MPATKRTLEECYENELDLLVEIMNAKKKRRKISGEDNLLLKALLGSSITKDEEIDNNISFYDNVTNVSCMRLIKELRELDNKIQKSKKQNKPDHIKLHISSYGGSLFDLMGVIDTIRTLKTPVWSYIQGYAASCGSLMAVVCKKRFIYRNSYSLIHQLSSGCSGNWRQIEDDFYNCSILMDDIRKIYLEHTKFTPEKLEEILRKDIWLRAEECLEYGVVDEIL
jgi:ATP-dependent protease ClpP protease subunit